MAKDRESVMAKVIHVPTGEVLATGEVDVCCVPRFVDDVLGLVAEARERMQDELSGGSDSGSGGVTRGSTTAYRKGYEGIVWNRDQVGEA